MGKDIFISYSRKDRDLVKAISAEIEKETGSSCWVDLNDIPPGDDYLDRIVAGIEQCKVFVFMLSESSQKAEHAIGELVAAKMQSEENGIHVVIVNIDNCKMSKKFVVRFATDNAIMWNDAPQKENLIGNLKIWLDVQDEGPTSPEEQFQLGEDYHYRLSGKQDYTEAVKWYRKAAEQGHADAQINLCLMYNNGIGVTQNDTEAVNWCRKAAEQGHVYAQYFLGRMYKKGKGVTQSDTEAVKWFRKAAGQGHKVAEKELLLLGYEAQRLDNP